MSHNDPQTALSPHISYRLAMASIAAAASALLLAVVLLIAVEFFSLRSTLLDESRVKAELIADNISAALVFQDATTAAEIIRTLRASPVVKSASVIDSDNVTVASFPHGFATPPDAGRFGKDGYRFSLKQLEMLTPVSHQGEQIGHIYIVVSMQALYRQLGLFSLASLSIAILAMIIAYTLLSRVRHSVSQAEQKLTHLAHVDAVTGLANRNAFNERLEFAIREAEKFAETLAILLLDLDNFKQVNDTLGHQAGDEMLRIIGQRIVKTLRRDDIVARLGGDEFAIILRNVGAHNEATMVCNKLVDAIAQPVQVEGHDFFVTASIGVAFYPEDGNNSAALTKNADTAMYQAKNAGKNAFEVFLPEMNASVKKRVSMEACLRNALQNKELSLAYQPKVDLMNGTLLGFEALLRWHNDQLGGAVSPGDFIPVAEDSGLIVPIGEWVIEQALLDLRKWNAGRPKKLHVAVNLSARQLKVEGTIRRIAALLADAAVPADWLELELTESLVMENVHAQIETFHELRRLGVRLAIDDFGTGYSSMGYLKRLPIDTLKIDRSFVSDLPMDHNDLAIATAIVALGHSLGLAVVAEGIETEAQADALLNLGCDIGQGYLYARPMPRESVERYLTTLLKH